MQRKDTPDTSEDRSTTRTRRVRHRLTVAALVSAWIALVCADAANGPGPWLWAAVAATWGALALLGARVQLHRRRYAGQAAR
jgi:hypothetical protein